MEMRAVCRRQMRSREGKRRSKALTKWRRCGHCKNPDAATRPNAWCGVISAE